MIGFNIVGFGSGEISIPLPQTSGVPFHVLGGFLGCWLGVDTVPCPSYRCQSTLQTGSLQQCFRCSAVHHVLPPPMRLWVGALLLLGLDWLWQTGLRSRIPHYFGMGPKPQLTANIEHANPFARFRRYSSWSPFFQMAFTLLSMELSFPGFGSGVPRSCSNILALARTPGSTSPKPGVQKYFKAQHEFHRGSLSKSSCPNSSN